MRSCTDMEYVSKFSIRISLFLRAAESEVTQMRKIWAVTNTHNWKLADKFTTPQSANHPIGRKYVNMTITLFSNTK